MVNPAVATVNARLVVNKEPHWDRFIAPTINFGLLQSSLLGLSSSEFTPVPEKINLIYETSFINVRAARRTA
jgi:hypothetical protein